MASGLVINRQAVEKLQNYLNDSSYRDAVENSASYNTRLSLEKRMRLPFLDAQTGVAQNHCNLWMEPRHRMPGEKPGQMYTYPAKRWKKKRRSYLSNFMQIPRKKELPQGDSEVESTVIQESASVVVQSNNEDSKDSAAVGSKDEGSKEAWLYEELQAEADDFEEPEADSDYDYEESYSKKKRKKATPKATPKATVRGRKKQIPVNYDATDTEKPYSCETCGARYKTRPGLTYHYTHTHKNLLEDDDEDSSAGNSASTPMSSTGTPLAPPHSSVTTPGPSSSTPSYMETPTGSSRGRSSRQGAQQPQQPVQVLQPPPPQQQQHLHPMGGASLETTPRRSNAPPAPYSMMHVPAPVVQQPPVSYGMPVASPAVREMEMKPRAAPSSYCDFCLGDATENKKTGHSEELVSCADCGRSGHPSCLQFTPNMIISVKQYRWQCIECKCCSLCGNSDNDDQLLFCDDCDRGYHMYCLKPPLTEPPEGSWSCHLCLVVFHRK